MAKFKIGDPKPANSGRKPGVKNKTTQEIRDAIQTVLANKVEELVSDLEKMNEFKQWTILNAVARYCLPQLNKNDDTIEHSGEMNITVTFEGNDSDNALSDNSSEVKD